MVKKISSSSKTALLTGKIKIVSIDSGNFGYFCATIPTKMSKQTDLTYKSTKPDIWKAYKQLLDELSHKPASPTLSSQAQKLSVSSAKTLKQSLANLHQLLDDELENTISGFNQINQTLEKFIKVKQTQEEQIEEENRLQKKRFQQEEEEFAYEFAKRKKTQEDDLAQTKKEQEETLKSRQAELDAAESELKDLHKLAESLDQKIQNATAEAIKQTTTNLTKDFEHQQALDKAQAQAKIELLEQKVTFLEKENSLQEKEIKSLQQSLSTASSNLTHIAQSAVSRSEKSQATTEER